MQLTKLVKENLSVKGILFSILLLVFLSYPAQVLPTTNQYTNVLNKVDVVDRLNKMHQAIIKKNYVMIFTGFFGGNLNASFEYRHAVFNNKQFAKLLYLEGSRKEIFQKEDIVSYYQQDTAPFSINSPRIIESFPKVVFNDFGKLSKYYDFIPMGQERIANRTAQLIHIVPKNKDRNNYMIWLDDDSFIPLRIDLCSPKQALIEQFKIVSLSRLRQNQLISEMTNSIQKPPVLNIFGKTSSLSNKWQLTWLPAGFSEKSHLLINYKKTDVDTRFYSDGVFSFTVNISEAPLMIKSYSLRSSNKIMYITHFLNKEIAVIGDLPLDTIKKIAKRIKFETSS